MRLRLLGTGLAFATLLSTARAENFAEPVTDSEAAETMRNMIGKSAGAKAEEGVSERLKAIASLPGTVLVDSMGNDCPFRLTAINNSDMDAWNVPINMKQGASESEVKGAVGETIHIPFIPAHSRVRAQFECIRSTVRVRKYDPAPTLIYSFSRLTGGDPLTPETVSEMLAESADTKTTDLIYARKYFTVASPGKTKAAAALELITDAERLTKFGRLLAASEEGAQLLAKAVTPARIEPYIDIVRTLPASAKGTPILVSVLLQQTIGADLAEKFSKVLAAQCAVRGRARGIWTTVMSSPDAAAALRRTVGEKCRPTEAGGIASWLNALPTDSLDGVLPFLPASDIPAVMPSLVTSPDGRTALGRFLAATEDAPTFEVVLTTLLSDAANGPELAARLAEAKSGNKLFARQLTALTQLVDALSGDAQKKALDGVLKGISDGQVQDSEVLKAVKAQLAKLPDGGAGLLADRIREDSKVLSPDAVLAAVNAKKLDGFEFLRSNHADLSKCSLDREAFISCVDLLKNRYPEYAAAGLNPAFAKEVQSILSAAGPVQGAEDGLWTAIRAYRDWKVDVTPAVSRLCEAAEKGREGYRSRRDRDDEPEPVILARMELFKDEPCVAEYQSARSHKRLVAGATAFLQLVLMPLPLVGLFFYGRRRWWKVRDELMKKTDEDIDEGETAVQRLTSRWPAAFKDALEQTREIFEAHGTPETRAALDALKTAQMESVALERNALLLATASLESGQTRSALAKVGDVNVYLVAFPGRHDQPQLLRRHAGFIDGWTAHVAALKASIPEADAKNPLLSLLFFVRPDAHDGVLVPAFDFNDQHLLPGTLLDAREAKTASGRSIPDQVELALNVPAKR